MSSYPNANQMYAPSPDVLYQSFRTQIDEALAQPFLQKENNTTPEVTLFALLVYTVCGSKRYPNETITTLYRLFLQDVANRPDGEQMATPYQTLLNQAITKFSETPITGALTPALQKLSEISAGMMGLSTAQIPFVYGFIQKGLNVNYGSAQGSAAPNAFPTQPTPPTQAYGAPTYGTTTPSSIPSAAPTYQAPTSAPTPPTSTGQGVSGAAAYSVSDFSAPPTTPQAPPNAQTGATFIPPTQTPSYTAQPTSPPAPQHTPYGGQGVSGSSTYSVSDFSAPPTPPQAQTGTVPPQPQGNLQYFGTGTPPTTVAPNNAPPAYQGQGYVPPTQQPPYNNTQNGQPQYTTLFNSPQVTVVSNPLNKIGGWLLALLVIVGLNALYIFADAVTYISRGGPAYIAGLYMLIALLSIVFIVLMCMHKKAAIAAFFVYRIWDIIFNILIGTEAYLIVAAALGMILLGVYLLKSKRVAAVLGVEKTL